MPLDLVDLTKLLEARRRERSQSRVTPADVIDVRRCLGLEPLPPRTDLHLSQQHRSEFDGYAVERWSFESQPGVVVPITLYRPLADGPQAVIVYAADVWGDGRHAEWAQSFGISHALHGFVTITIDPPGIGDRAAMGNRQDPTLADAAPTLGVFAWDLVRALDCIGTLGGLISERVGLTGAGFGGDAALLASVIDERFAATAVTGAGHSQDTNLSGAFSSVAGLSELGDWAHLLAARAPKPLLLMVTEEDDPAAVEATHKKLGGLYRKHDGDLHWVRFLGGPDYSRRMRETAAAFFRNHLMGDSKVAYAVEPRPLTDSAAHPFPSGTLPADGLSEPVDTLGLREVRRLAMATPYPGKDAELRPWGKHGGVEPPVSHETLRLVDSGESPNVLVLPTLPEASLVAVGMSAPEFYAQVLHLLLPGGPEGWEPLALKGDSISAMIASVRTLVKANDPVPLLTEVEAEGPLSSITALFLKLHRPSLVIRVTHEPRSWEACAELGLLVPGARYRPWPWPAIEETVDAPEERVESAPSEDEYEHEERSH